MVQRIKGIDRIDEKNSLTVLILEGQVHRVYCGLGSSLLASTELKRAGCLLNVPCGDRKDRLCHNPSNYLADANGTHTWVLVESNQATGSTSVGQGHPGRQVLCIAS